MIHESERQDIIDQEHLRLLPIFYWVSGAFAAFLSLFSVFYIGLGLLFLATPFQQQLSPAAQGPPPAAFGWFFVGFGLVFLVLTATFATLQILTGIWIRKQRRRVLCLVTGGISCALVPFGTLLGVFTFSVLLRPSVIRLFGPAGPEAEVPPVNVPPKVG